MQASQVASHVAQLQLLERCCCTTLAQRLLVRVHGAGSDILRSSWHVGMAMAMGLPGRQARPDQTRTYSQTIGRTAFQTVAAVVELGPRRRRAMDMGFAGEHPDPGVYHAYRVNDGI